MIIQYLTYITFKIALIIVAIIGYPIVILGVWLEKQSSSYRQVGFLEANKYYWRDVRYIIKLKFKESKFNRKGKKK